MIVYLDGHQFTLAENTAVTRTPLTEWPENIRFDGQQQRKDRRWISSWNISNWSGGLGIERQNAALTSHLYRLWDAENVDTRFNQIILSPKAQVCTIVPSRGDLGLYTQVTDDLYFWETQRGNDATSISYRYTFTAPNTLGSSGRIIVTSNLVGAGSLSSVRAFGKAALFSCAGSGSALSRFWRLGDITNAGEVPTYPGGAAPFAGAIGAVKPVIGDIGGTAHALAYVPADEAVTFLVCNQGLTASLAIVGTTVTVVGSYMAPLVTDGLTMYANLPNGIWNFDITPNIIVDTSRSQDKNNMQVMFQNYLFFKNKKSLIEYDGTDVVNRGFDAEDGLPSDKLGEITAMTASWKWIFSAVKGATYSHILTMDAAAQWHYYARAPSPGIVIEQMFLSDSPDGYDRLWCVPYGGGYPFYYLNPMVNPLQAATYSFVPTGHFTLPVYDGGMAEENGTFLDMAVTADNMGSNNISAFYGLNGAAAVTTLGRVATTMNTLKFGSPYGVEGHRIQPKFILSNEGAAGTTPVFREATIHYLKDPSRRDVFDLTVDIKKTAKARGNNAESIIATLGAIRDKKTLVPFFYGQIGTREVKVLDIPTEEKVTEDVMLYREREGLVTLRLAELI